MTKVSRLTELLRAARKADSQMGADLEKEVAALMKRRTFGLVFEQHQPEAVELPDRTVRRGDKVRVLPPRGEVKQGDQRLWRVERIERTDGARVGHLKELDAEEPETHVVRAEDLVVVAEFHDRIYPGLVETGRVEHGGPDKPFHTVINAENYHALEMLTYTHRHSIDAIYIDPPYNTGAKDWKYNNDYVETDDDYRHSKWLAFMERRLEISRELLNPDDSVLIVTIDEKEVHRLGLLLQQVYPEARIQIVSTIINPQGISSGADFSRVNEFIFFLAFGQARLRKWNRSMIENDKEASDVSQDQSVRWADFARYGANAGRENSPGAHFPIFVNTETETIHSVGEALAPEGKRSDVTSPLATRAVWPPSRPGGADGRWRTTADTCRQLLSEGLIRVGPYNRRAGRHSFAYLQDGAVRKIRTGEILVTGYDEKGAAIVKYAANTKEATPKTIWTLPSHDASRHGSNLLRQILPGRQFPFPKSLYAVEDALRFFVKTKPEAIVLDFFSGSGTTAHAIMRLNKQDGGGRQCISVTNNEVSAAEQKLLRKKGLRPGDPDWEALGICDYITKPRLTAAITGETPKGDPIRGDYKFTDEFPISKGFEENAAFFTLTYEDSLPVRHDRTFARIAPMLWLRAGSRGRIIEDLGEDGWDVAESYGVLKNMDQMGDFTARVAEIESVETVFVVTDSDAAFQMTCRDLPARVTPVRLYESYLHNFAINRRA